MSRTRRRLTIVFALAGLFVAVTVGASLAAVPIGGSFGDDDGNTHEANIEVIADQGVTKGCNPPTNDMYCPDGTVTRGQMAAFLVRALDLPATATDYFIDDDGTTFEGDINRLREAGITFGCNPPINNMYCPGGFVTRGQMAAFLVRAFGYDDDGGGDLFTDDDGSTFEQDIDKLGTARVTVGCNPPTNDRFCPNNRVKRDQMASFLARALAFDDPGVPKPSDLCDPSYPDYCMPPPPPDLNCADIPAGKKPLTVVGADPHILDGNDDGIGCES